MQNPPWERKDEFDIDDRPKKKSRVSDRWFFEVVYPEGLGPEDFEDNEDEREKTPERSESQSPRHGNSRTKSLRNRRSSPAAVLCPQSTTSSEQSANGAGVNNNTHNEEYLEKSHPQKFSPQQQHSIATATALNSSSASNPASIRDVELLDSSPPSHTTSTIDSGPLSKTSPEPQSPPTSEEAWSSLDGGTVTSKPGSVTLELPTSRQLPFQSHQTKPPNSHKPGILSSSSPLSSLCSSPLLPPGTQFTTLLNQQEDTSQQSNPPSSDLYLTTTPFSPSQRSLQRDDSGYKSAQSEDEPSNLDSSQVSSRPLRNFKGRDLFDSIIWADAYSTSIFYMFITSFRQKVFNNVESTSPAHKFIKTLRDGGRLVRNYTQNIDSLEEREGLSTNLALGPGSRARFHSKTQRERRPSDVPGDSPHSTGVECVQLHGSLVSLRCGLCSKLSRWDEADRESTTLAGQAPDCPSCVEYNARRTGRGRRGLAVGRLRPDIVLYGEEHPNANLVAPLITHDLGLGPDILLIMGTSLKVHGLKILVKEFAKAVHAKGGSVILVNRTKPPESTWGDVIDYWVEWDCDAWVLDLKARRSDIWLPQGSAAEESKGRRELAKELSKKRRELSREHSGEAKPRSDSRRPSRPSATREDRMSGVYHTFKILDLLWNLADDRGQRASRSIYWQKPTRTPAAPAPETEPSSIGPRAQPTERANRGSAKSSKRRKSHPSSVRDEDPELENMASLNMQWKELCAAAPGLPTQIPEGLVRSTRMALAEAKTDRPNLPAILTGFKFSFTPGYGNGTSSHIPNLRGLSIPAGMSLISHPPSGATLPLHSPRTAVESRAVNHPYGTRSAPQYPADSIVVDDAELSTEDTIVVEPLTPNAKRIKRIKRMGSLGRILSSSPEIYHDAEERTDMAGSASSQEFHDAIEWVS